MTRVVWVPGWSLGVGGTIWTPWLCTWITYPCRGSYELAITWDVGSQ